MSNADAVSQFLADFYPRESRRVFATLVRLVGDFDLAEESLHEAFTAAMEQWTLQGIPANPRAWLVSTGRFKAIDTLRRRSLFRDSLGQLAEQRRPEQPADLEFDEAAFRDDQLRLIFTCCHPALAHNTQIALTLREVCGLSTEEVASAFLTSPTTIAQRIVRGKAKIREAKIPYVIPQMSDLQDRIDAVLSVIYLVFNEGYSASSGEDVTRVDLSAEAIRLGRLLQQLLPHPEVQGLLALMLLHDSRRQARVDAAGNLVLLNDQDRSLWNKEQLEQGIKLVQQSLQTRRFGIYTLQAAIAAVHAETADAALTDWPQIVALYTIIMQLAPSPVVELNRAVAIAMRDSPQAGLELIEAILARGDLQEYHLAHAACADLYRRSGQFSQAIAAYERALSLARQEPEQRFLRQRLQELKDSSQ